MTDDKQYPPLPDFEEVEQHIYGASRRYIPQGMLEPIHDLMRAYVDADRAMRAAQAAPAAVAEPVAWLHDDPQRYDVIHAEVKDLLVKFRDAAGYLHRPLDKSAHYTIPLYTAPAAPASQDAEDALMKALERAYFWMDSQADTQSKGGHATFDLMMLREERDAAKAAIDAARARQEGK